MPCRYCGAEVPDKANYCPACGAPQAPAPFPEMPVGSPRRGWGIFALTLLGSLGVSLLLTLVLGWPVFILGAVLPLFWPLFGRRRPPSR